MQDNRLKTARKFATDVGNAQSRLFSIAFGILGNRQDAEDVVQQAIAIAIEKNESFDSDFQFVGWLSGVVRNCALNHRRKGWRRKTHATDPEQLLSVEMPDVGESPIDEAGKINPLQQSFDDQLQTALQQVAPKARSCLLLRIVDGLSYREISELMDVSESSAMNMVHRGKKQLRNILSSRKEEINEFE